MNYILTLISLFTFCIMPGISQNKTLTLEDLTPGGKNYNKYVPKNISGTGWIKDKYVLTENNTVFTYNAGDTQKKQTKLFDLTDINNALAAKGNKELKKLPALKFGYNDPIASFNFGGALYLYDFEKKTIVSKYASEKNDKNSDFCKESNKLAVTNKNNLFVIKDNGERLQITNDSNAHIVNGQAVHRNEFGINKGTFWSPAGNFLCFYRMDERMVKDYPLVDIAKREAELDNIKYPMAGMKSHQVKVGIYDFKKNRTLFLKTGEPKDRYFTNISWSPDEKYVYIAELNRRQDTMQLVKYNIDIGTAEGVLYTETHSKYVEPQTPILFLKNDPDKFILESQRDGFNHLYLYNTKGKLIKQLTKGNWIVTGVVSFDQSGNNLFYYSTEVSPLERHLYKLNIKTGKSTRLTSDSGVHQVTINDDGNYFIDNYSNKDVPRNIEVVSVSTGKKVNLLEASNPYKGIDLPTIEVGTIKAADDSTDLFYRMVKPVNFDPDKKYPVIVYVYGGPHAQMILNQWMSAARGWDIYMAQRGYIVFTVDNRGSSNRGLEFENATHHALGREEMKDQLKGVEFLKKKSFVDADRIGVHGWSYGGYMTTSLLLHHGDVFKVGVAGGPVIDWKFYEVMYGERYMGTPETNKEGYELSNLNNYVQNLKGHLLLIHGDIDPVVVLQHSLSFLKNAVAKNSYPDYFIYPGHEHNVMGADRVHLHEKITRYFEDHL